VTTVNIPPEVRAVFDDYYKRLLKEQFGDTPPTHDQELGFIDELVSSGVSTVPMMNGSVATIASDGMADDNAEMDSLEVAGPASGSGQPNWLRSVGGIVLFGVAALVLLWQFVLPNFFGKGNPSAAPASTPGALAVNLPAGIDALVSSGDTKVPLVVPRTLEIAAGDGVSQTAYVVVPVKVAQADWPCPIEKDAARACWVNGTVVNYLMGIPYDARSVALAAAIRERGGTLLVRLSTERVLTFNAHVVEVERHETEVLAQKRFGVTVPLLGQKGNTRTVILGEYAMENARPAAATVAAGSSQSAQPEISSSPLMSVIALGETVQFATIELSPIGHIAQANESRLTVQVTNRGALPLSAGSGWRVNTLLTDGTSIPARVEGSSIMPNSTGLVVCIAPGEASAWRISVGGQEVTVALQ